MKLPATQLKKIALFRALQLGDMLCIIPAVRALRSAYPNANITLIGLPWAKQFAERFKQYFDDFLSFPGYPGLPEQPFNASAFTSFLTEVQALEFDLVLQMQGNGSIVNTMVELFDGKNTAGFRTQGHYAPDNGLFMNYPDHGHEIERHLWLMQHLGITTQGTFLEFPLLADDEDELNALQLGVGAKRYVCIHPGSRGSWRQWPVEHFAALANYCYEAGYQVVLTGTRDEKDIIAAVIANMKYPAINTAGLTGLGAVALLIKNASLLVSNCTGVSHIAAAFKTPSIVISMDGEPQRWGPINDQLHRTINWLEQPGFEYVLDQLVGLMSQQRIVAA